jgi:hypothetical protein
VYVSEYIVYDELVYFGITKCRDVQLPCLEILLPLCSCRSMANHWFAPYRQASEYCDILQYNCHLVKGKMKYMCLQSPPSTRPVSNASIHMRHQGATTIFSVCSFHHKSEWQQASPRKRPVKTGVQMFNRVKTLCPQRYQLCNHAFNLVGK